MDGCLCWWVDEAIIIIIVISCISSFIHFMQGEGRYVSWWWYSVINRHSKYLYVWIIDDEKDMMIFHYYYCIYWYYYYYHHHISSSWKIRAITFCCLQVFTFYYQDALLLLMYRQQIVNLIVHFWTQLIIKYKNPSEPQHPKLYISSSSYSSSKQRINHTSCIVSIVHIVSINDSVLF